MKKTHTLILSITILLVKLSNATNLISNGGFESGSSVAFFQHGLGKEQKLDLSHLQKGVYVVKIVQQGVVSTGKVVVE